jgi:hypothetical protein
MFHKLKSLFSDDEGTIRTASNERKSLLYTTNGVAKVRKIIWNARQYKKRKKTQVLPP